MLNFSISTIGPATFSPVLLPNVKHVWAVFIVFRTQRTSFLPPTSSIMLYSALEQTLSTLLSLVRNLSNTTSQSLPCCPCGQTTSQVFALCSHKPRSLVRNYLNYFVEQYLILGIVHISSNGSPRITGQSILSMTRNYAIF